MFGADGPPEFQLPALVHLRVIRELAWQSS